jgi:cell division protease FtsH
VPEAGTLSLAELPRELDALDAIEAVYGEDLDWAVERLSRGASVLFECDKALGQFLYIAVRQRLKTSCRGKRSCRLVDGRRIEGPGGLMQKVIADLANAVKEEPEGTILVLPHLDLLTTTTRSGLTQEAREAIVWFYENPEITFLAFKDTNLELPQTITDLFPAHRMLVGIPRKALPRVILQREARKFGVESFRPFHLYKYVSGLNVLKLRRILEQFHDVRDFDPANPGTAAGILREIRKMTVVGEMDLPQVSLTEDIGGYRKVKQRIGRDLLDLYQKRDQMTAAEEVQSIEELLPKGIILEGPPGTGKTFFAKAIATALDATLQVVSGPELKSKWVGESEANLRRVFTRARESAPSIIVFDELDSFATRRGTYASSGVEHSMVNQLLTEMDGFHKDELVLVVGTTNFVESLDPALLRPGRFELQITIPYPGEKDRQAILEIYRKKFALDMPDEVLELLVRKTEGFVNREQGVKFSGDHLHAICRGLKRNVVRKGPHPISEEEALKAIERESSEDVELNEEEERVVASHEAGHALLAALLEDATWPEKIVVNPDEEGALGYVIREVKKNRYITSRAELVASIVVGMGGRVAEELLIGEIGVGAYDDLRKATELATLMVESLGMSELGPVVFSRTNAHGETVRRDLSPGVSEKVDEAIGKILERAYQQATRLLSGNREALEKIVVALLKAKTIDGDAFKSICREAGIGTDHHQAASK